MKQMKVIESAFLASMPENITSDIHIVQYDSNRLSNGSTVVFAMIEIYQYENTAQYHEYIHEKVSKTLEQHMGYKKVVVATLRSDLHDDFVKYLFSVYLTDTSIEYTNIVNWNLTKDEMKLIHTMFDYNTMWGDDFQRYGGNFRWRTLTSLIKKGFLTYEPNDDNNGSVDFTRNFIRVFEDNLPAPQWVLELFEKFWVK